MNNIFDSHAHYTDSAFDDDRHPLLAFLPKAGVCGIINCGTDIKDSKESVLLSHKYDFMYAAVGIHPHEAGNTEDCYLAQLSELLEDRKVVAIGEIGLDYHYDFSPREIQKRLFNEQLHLAVKFSLPVIIHNRKAHADTLEILKEHKPAGVMHCFSGSVEVLKEVLELNMYIGLGGAITFNNAKKALAVAAAVPLDRLLIETDCPYMAPEPHRGKRNDSSLIPFAAAKIAEIKNISVDEVLKATAENAQKLFLQEGKR
ncbi:MAG TPA: TatD family hydrolase [Clostridia bacterium]|nr:TatD family hydrolase [Clostridia bacterium]